MVGFQAVSRSDASDTIGRDGVTCLHIAYKIKGPAELDVSLFAGFSTIIHTPE